MSNKTNVAVKGETPDILFIEPFYGGSHKELIDTIIKSISTYTLVTMPCKKWHWRSRCGALSLMTIIPKVTTEKVLFCSSILNLAELLGLRPDLNSLKKVIYFHENQLIYPIQEIKNRDIQYSYNQIISCLAADIVIFNSNFNKNSFLSNIKKIIKLIPDYRSTNLEGIIRKKCEVLYFPVTFPEKPFEGRLNEKSNVLRIVWPHRWEFDKCPEDFFNVLLKLKTENIKFEVVVLGECYREIPEIMNVSREKLENEIVHCGYIDSKSTYFQTLMKCDVVVSTSHHEFFGVAMIEAAYCGCFPLVPNNLVYPEIYPNNCLYSNIEDLYARLKCYCLNPTLAYEDRSKLDLSFEKYSSVKLTPEFLKILNNK
ncbi:glycosyltransferase-like domain-containing protein 1 [Harmonia axyridis]|uniref:glycosyltransferase-like domain-containing protein 1 n=1 Tax=Harmonia axyridis TaxID=115357 RepID=UPI001E277E89|nr:glycosyltransferase-like domain-containing protein 1 [Harmonia axyridis]